MSNSEAMEEHLLEKNPSPIVAFDRETLDILTVNEAAIRQYGYSKSEFLTMTIDDIHPSGEVSGLIERCALPGTDCKMDPIRAGVFKHRRKDGSLMEAEIVCYPMPVNGRDAIVMLIMDVHQKAKQRRIA